MIVYMSCHSPAQFIHVSNSNPHVNMTAYEGYSLTHQRKTINANETSKSRIQKMHMLWYTLMNGRHIPEIEHYWSLMSGLDKHQNT